MELTTILLLLLGVTWLVVIPLLVIFPPKTLSGMRSAVQRRRHLRVLRSAVLDAKAWQVAPTKPAAASATTPSPSPVLYAVPANRVCLLVFVNPKSGGQLGDLLLGRLKALLPPQQVFDLSGRSAGPVEPERVLSQFTATSNVRILCAGGDGTAAWIAQSNLAAGRLFPIAILPLGTGNDLSRTFGWGSGSTESSIEPERLVEVLARTVTAHPTQLDYWRVSFFPLSSDGSNGGNAGAAAAVPTRTSIMFNYASVGLDADIAIRFHEQRHANPDRFRSQSENLLRYAALGFEHSFTSRPLENRVRDLRCGAAFQTRVPFDLAPVKCLIISNLSVYQGGRSFWGEAEGSCMNEADHVLAATLSNGVNAALSATSSSSISSTGGAGGLAMSSSGTFGEFHDSRVDDGELECMAMSGCLHFGLTHCQLDTAIRVAQSKAFSVTLAETQAMQLDGEPSIVEPCRIEFVRAGQYPLLEHVD